MPGFSDYIFIFILALLLFGPKKLPVLARELGKWIGEFRRASNEFKLQMEEELRNSEREDREKRIAAMEAAAPKPQLGPLEDPTPEPEHPHMEPPAAVDPEEVISIPDDAPATSPTEPLPIATSGDLSIMPPATGLPTPRSSRASSSPLGGLLGSIPSVSEAPAKPAAATSSAEPSETATHG